MPAWRRGGGEEALATSLAGEGVRIVHIASPDHFIVVVLRAAGNPNVLLTATPPAVNLGDVPPGTRRQAFVFLRYTGEEAFAIRGATSDPGGLALTVRETPPADVAERLRPRSHGRVQLGKDARVIEVAFEAASLGDFKGEVTIESDVKRYEKPRVPVTGRVVPPVAAAPSLVSFGLIRAGATGERSLLPTSALAKPFKVASVAPKAAGFEWPVAPGEVGLELRLAATADAARQLSASKLTVRVEQGEGRFDLTIPVFASGAP